MISLDSRTSRAALPPGASATAGSGARRPLAAGLVPLVLSALALALLPTHADAQRGGGENARFTQTGPRLTLADLERIAPRLESANPAEVQEALFDLVVIDKPEVVPPIAALLRRGQPDAITDDAIRALGQLEAPEAIEVLTEFTNHRRTPARRAAYEALGAIDDRRVPALLARGLSDGDRGIRGSAASLLGEMGPRARSEIDRLFLAFERGVVEAGPAVGKVGAEDTIERFHAFLEGTIPFAVMLSGYRAYLGREDISLEAKTGIVVRLNELGTVAARDFLNDYLNELPDNPRSRRVRKLREAVEEALRTIYDQKGKA
ncbi:MAG: HEAT repeat domain-containing protein [Myxococcota bacterium]